MSHSYFFLISSSHKSRSSWYLYTSRSPSTWVLLSIALPEGHIWAPTTSSSSSRLLAYIPLSSFWQVLQIAYTKSQRQRFRAVLLGRANEMRAPFHVSFRPPVHLKVFLLSSFTLFIIGIISVLCILLFASVLSDAFNDRSSTFLLKKCALADGLLNPKSSELQLIANLVSNNDVFLYFHGIFNRGCQSIFAEVSVRVRCGAP